MWLHLPSTFKGGVMRRKIDWWSLGIAVLLFVIAVGVTVLLAIEMSRSGGKR